MIVTGALPRLDTAVSRYFGCRLQMRTRSPGDILWRAFRFVRAP